MSDDEFDKFAEWSILDYSKDLVKAGLSSEETALEKFRKQGYGKQSLLLLEKEAKEKGLNKILLNVFKYNKPALSLYKSLEYKIRDKEAENVSMLKNI